MSQRPLPVELPRFRLASLPTPLHDAPRLARAIGVDRLLVKRDDLTGFAGGGNKVRKLEFLVGDALATGADTLIATGGPQSNAVRTAMVAARVAGLDPIAVLYGAPPPGREGNLLLDVLAGARLVFTGDPDRAATEAVAEELAAELRAAGRRPYVLPRGAATPVGDAGYVEAAAELAAQLEEIDVQPAAVVVANGSGGTQAGLIAGTAWLGASYRITGILVSRPRQEAVPRLLELARSTAGLLQLATEIGPRDIHVEEGVPGAAFGVGSAEGEAALRLALTTEGLILDPVYTAPTLAGLIRLVEHGTFDRTAPVVFVHTGGEPALYARHGEDEGTGAAMPADPTHVPASFMHV
ncbi:MAG: pyridoxal-phosphate dependent enzyme [Candidatus Limnocylindrales bacterium]|nr:pyridoxal-phosphate dependent enzyme [Candidatus Limnocylindrales bacterium]